MENIVYIIPFAACFLLALIVVLLIVFDMYKNHFSVTKGIVNYDYGMKEFVYKVPLTKKQIFERLRLKNVTDVLEYTLNEEDFLIAFSKYGDIPMEYTFSIDEVKDFSILRVKQCRNYYQRSNIPLFLNPFWAKKVNAEVIPFQK